MTMLQEFANANAAGKFLNEEFPPVSYDSFRIAGNQAAHEHVSENVSIRDTIGVVRSVYFDSSQVLAPSVWHGPTIAELKALHRSFGILRRRQVAKWGGLNSEQAPLIRLIKRYENEAAKTNAIGALAAMPEGVPLPTVWLGDGEIGFEWIGEEMHAVLSFEDDGSIGYTMLKGKQFVPGEFEAEVNSFPSDLASYLRSF
ncbi:MAG TPA: hypothetical protein VGV39_04520 [Mesorhizobium sp.]|jgi:hypothetical protein|uniref:hypothetical protein n=1 Tax=Mesorhizobium sp. TaxID=1871066 RepID=UPI002DDCC50E|nr:hypothetical protein [Mesorhizobium sp.]HEV2502312.1 hypothetical protein [Mesorhizobium sp.]